jgi:hypothetical protein
MDFEFIEPPAPVKDLPWTHEQAVGLCRLIEPVAKNYGCHVALTGGCLYKDGVRKDCDILFYRIRQVERIDVPGLFAALADIGIERGQAFGDWLIKAHFHGKDVDCFFPEGSGEVPWEVLEPGEYH